jgi:hypothetical protein
VKPPEPFTARPVTLDAAIEATALVNAFDRAYLAADAGNETSATHLYESVGMRVAWQADVYEKRM